MTIGLLGSRWWWQGGSYVLVIFWLQMFVLVRVVD